MAFLLPLFSLLLCFPLFLFKKFVTLNLWNFICVTALYRIMLHYVDVLKFLLYVFLFTLFLFLQKKDGKWKIYELYCLLAILKQCKNFLPPYYFCCWHTNIIFKYHMYKMSFKELLFDTVSHALMYIC